jgi:hypothetical protein
MTMGYCRTCGRDVHITHDESECTGEPNVRVPELERGRVEREEHDEPARDPPDVY